MASQLAEAQYDVRVLRLESSVNNQPAYFEAKGRVLREAGWKKLLAGDEATQDEESDADGPENPVPSLTAGTTLTAIQGTVNTKKTKPAGRFSEASLVRELENKGIGRPATFAAIVDTIMRREYVRTEKRFLVPTPLGEKVVDLLGGAFSFLDYEFTKHMENELDAIAGGKASYKMVMAKAHDHLQKELAAFIAKYPASQQPYTSKSSGGAKTYSNSKPAGKPSGKNTRGGKK